MAAASPVPSLSQIRAWDTYHLADAATAWRTTADQWEETFSHVARQMPAPAGIPWEGAGAEGAQLRAHTDLVTVRGMADSLRSASTVAGEGANEIYTARQSVLYAVEDAEGAGFTVGEDLSVISRQTGGPRALQAARQAQAQALAADIRAKAATLTATDQEVAAKVTTAAAGLRGVTLGDGQSLPPDRDATQRKPRFKAVDQHVWRQGPGDGGEPPQPPPLPRPVEPPPPEIGEIGEGGIGGTGGGPYIGPTFVPAPHSKRGIPILGKDDLDAPWEYEE